MVRHLDARDLAIALCARSTCAVQVAAVLSDPYGIFAWGWNSTGPLGLGQCAERHALLRANKARLKWATITVASVRRGKAIISFPCAEHCLKRVRAAGIGKVQYRDRSGEWCEVWL